MMLLDITTIDAKQVQLITIDENHMEIQVADQVEVKDEKPTKEAMLFMQKEVVKASLKKLTADTGVPPDRLYICREENCCAVLSSFQAWYKHMFHYHCCLLCSCPHCENVRSTDDSKLLEEHFLTHCRHTYLCFCCGETFVNEENIKHHSQKEHAEQEMRLESVQFNRKYAYFISITANLYADEYFLFLCELQQVLLEFIKRQKGLFIRKVRSEWSVPLDESCLDTYPVYNPSKYMKCFADKCPYKGRSMADYMNHLKTHNLENRTFGCFKCQYRFSSGNKSVPDIIAHLKQHSQKQIHICCVCSKTYDCIKALIAHNITEHNQRDAYTLSLKRTPNCKLFSLMFSFAVERKTFSTTKICFCCQESNIECLVIHLREKHQISLSYGCLLCYKNFPSLAASVKHHEVAHADLMLKLFAVIQSCNDIVISNIRPLKIEFNNAQKCVQASEEHNDEDILCIYEGDDLIIAEDLKAINHEQKLSGSKINCVNIAKLQKLT